MTNGRNAGPVPAATPAPPLHGVRVIEVGAFMAAPFATMQLADLGADVIKVENPDGGDPVRATGPFIEGHSSPFIRLNRNKRSIALDLKSDEGANALRKLLADADILVENLRPGVLTRLGFGYEAVAAINPRLVYVSASGWGQDGPLAALPGLDIMAQARSGLMSITGPADGEPAKVGVPICDLACGLYAALAAVAALHSARATGAGQHIDVSLLESGVSFEIWEAGRYWATGEIGAPMGSAHQSTAPYQALRTADGSVTVGAVTPKTWTAFCVALGLDELLEDPRLDTAHRRHTHRQELITRIEETTTQLTTADIVDRLDAVGVPCAPINNVGQAFDDDHLDARQFFWHAAHPSLGSVRQIGNPMRFSATPTVRGAAGPSLGQHSRELLAELGYSDDEVQRIVCAAGNFDHLDATTAPPSVDPD
jgi:crotonobetainyl-CoA:carnitine CoA-transferase CaiB-like acyl-CoA transferase